MIIDFSINVIDNVSESRGCLSSGSTNVIVMGWVWEWIGGEKMEKARLENSFRNVVVNERKETKL